MKQLPNFLVKTDSIEEAREIMNVLREIGYTYSAQQSPYSIVAVIAYEGRIHSYDNVFSWMENKSECPEIKDKAAFRRVLRLDPPERTLTEEDFVALGRVLDAASY